MPLIQAGFRHKGFALIDVLSPCVTFNDHEGSTKSYAFTREHYRRSGARRFRAPMTGNHRRVRGGRGAAGDHARRRRGVRLRKIDHNYNPVDRPAAYAYIQSKLAEQEFLTGLLYVEPTTSDFHDHNDTPPVPLNSIPYEKLSLARRACRKSLAATGSHS